MTPVDFADYNDCTVTAGPNSFHLEMEFADLFCYDDIANFANQRF